MYPYPLVSIPAAPTMSSYFEWGLNCQVLGLGETECQMILEPYGQRITQDERDMFFEGFVNGDPSRRLWKG